MLSLAADMVHTFRARAAAWAVHGYTATGAVLALLALLAVDRHDWTAAMLWLFAALVVDGVDGTLARAAHVKTVAPRIDGDALDLVIDYLGYVFVPALFMLEARLLPPPLALPLCAAILISSLYVFARRDMKTGDGYFRGFPALWNIVALYFFAASIDPAVAAAVVGALVILTFAPIHFLHPLRVRDYGPWPVILGAAWGASTLALLLPDVAQPVRQILFALSMASAIVIVALGLLRTRRGPRAPAAAPE